MSCVMTITRSMAVPITAMNHTERKPTQTPRWSTKPIEGQTGQWANGQTEGWHEGQEGCMNAC